MLRVTFFALAFLMSGSSAYAQAALPTGISKEELYGSVIRSSKWTIKRIGVCWEAMDEAQKHFRTIVQKAATETWQNHSRGAVVFSGWGLCEPNSPGIHIRIGDERARVLALGRYLDTMPGGMILNFSFQEWSQGCQSRGDFCVYALAAHEFGHALGFTHEQNREDAPEECRNERREGSVGDYNVTKYDPSSIMNYCNGQWNGNGKLSKLDVAALNEFYKP